MKNNVGNKYFRALVGIIVSRERHYSMVCNDSKIVYHTNISHIQSFFHRKTVKIKCSSAHISFLLKLVRIPSVSAGRYHPS